MPKKLTIQEWQVRSNDIHGVNHYTVVSLGKTSRSKSTIRCNICSDTFTQIISSHVGGKGCKKCSVKKRALHTRITKKEWQKRSNKIHGFGRYTILTLGCTSIDNGEIYCSKCLTVFALDMHHHCSSRRGCPICKKRGLQITKEQWQRKSDKVHGKGRYSILGVKVTREKSTILCTTCNTKFLQSLNAHCNGVGNGCPQCGENAGIKKRVIPKSKWQERSDATFSVGDYSILSTPRNSKDKSAVLCNSCNEVFSQPMDSHYKGKGCPKCARLGRASKGEDSLAENLQALDRNLSILRSDRVILENGKELDIVFPEQKVAVEYCGLYWHSEEHKEKKYHKEKYLRSLEKGYHLITVFEDEYLENPDKVISAIGSILGKSPKGKGARQLEVRKVVRKESKEFFKKYHLQGSAPQAVTYGLYDSSTLVSAMTFTKPQRQGGSYEWELRRFASDGEKHAGAASRLFSAFLKEYKPNSVGSMSDNRWFSGGMYKALGFDLDGEVPIDYTYIKNGKRYHKSGFRKDCIRKKLPDFYDKNKTEREMMKEAKYLRIHDCGKKRWIWKPQ